MPKNRFFKWVLVVGGGIAIAMALWRLYAGWDGSPENLWELSPVAWELSPQRLDERIERQKTSIQKARAADKDPTDREETLRELVASRDESVAEWQRAVTRARWKELRNAVVLLLVAGVLIESTRRWRSGTHEAEPLV